MLKDHIQIRRDTSSNFNLANPVLLNGELGYEIETGRSKIGSGSADYQTLGFMDQVGPHFLKGYLTSQLPSVTTHNRSMAWLDSENEPGYCDGTTWRKVSDGSIIFP